MGLLDEIKTAASDPRRFIGRKAAACRSCRGLLHYVNRAGGIACVACSPPSPADPTLRLTINAGAWIDANNGFETPAAPDLLAGLPATSPPPSLSRFDQMRANRIERAMHAFAPDYREWGWIDGAEFIEFNKWAADMAEFQRESK